MSELSRAISRAGVLKGIDESWLKRQVKAAFKSGWEAREILMNQRIAEIEKAAVLQERKRCAIICDKNGLNSSSPSNFADNCAKQIMAGK